MGDRYDFAPVERIVDPEGRGAEYVAACLDVHITTVAVWRRRGLSERQADHLAVAVGRTLGELWPEWWDEGAAVFGLLRVETARAEQHERRSRSARERKRRAREDRKQTAA